MAFITLKEQGYYDPINQINDTFDRLHQRMVVQPLEAEAMRGRIANQGADYTTKDLANQQTTLEMPEQIRKLKQFNDRQEQLTPLELLQKRIDNDTSQLSLDKGLATKDTDILGSKLDTIGKQRAALIDDVMSQANFGTPSLLDPNFTKRISAGTPISQPDAIGKDRFDIQSQTPNVTNNANTPQVDIGSMVDKARQQMGNVVSPLSGITQGDLTKGAWMEKKYGVKNIAQKQVDQDFAVEQDIAKRDAIERRDRSQGRMSEPEQKVVDSARRRMDESPVLKKAQQTLGEYANIVSLAQTNSPAAITAIKDAFVKMNTGNGVTEAQMKAFEKVPGFNPSMKFEDLLGKFNAAGPSEKPLWKDAFLEAAKALAKSEYDHGSKFVKVVADSTYRQAPQLKYDIAKDAFLESPDDIDRKFKQQNVGETQSVNQPLTDVRLQEASKWVNEILSNPKSSADDIAKAYVVRDNLGK